MRNDAYELVRIQGDQALPGQLGINVGCVGDAERVVRVNGDDLCFRPDETVEVFEVAGHHVCFVVFAQQECFNHAQAVRHVLGAPVGP